MAWFESQGRLLEAQRIKMRTNYDLEMLQEMGFCNGIENYSLHFGEPQARRRPFCLIDFFPKDFLLMIDESHATVPQIGGMYNGDRSQEADPGQLRLPAPVGAGQPAAERGGVRPDHGADALCLGHAGAFELGRSSRRRRAGDPPDRPPRSGDRDPADQGAGRGPDRARSRRPRTAGERVLVTTLTKRLSEDLTAYLREAEIRVEYLHSDIDTIERIEILRNLRLGNFDVLIGINLLREGLDLPEVALVAILDADKEGFLRSETSLIQTAGRAARHEKGRVILYADTITESIARTVEITNASAGRSRSPTTRSTASPRGA